MSLEKQLNEYRKFLGVLKETQSVPAVTKSVVIVAQNETNDFVGIYNLPSHDVLDLKLRQLVKIVAYEYVIETIDQTSNEGIANLRCHVIGGDFDEYEKIPGRNQAVRKPHRYASTVLESMRLAGFFAERYQHTRDGVLVPLKNETSKDVYVRPGSVIKVVENDILGGSLEGVEIKSHKEWMTQRGYATRKDPTNHD